MPGVTCWKKFTEAEYNELEKSLNTHPGLNPNESLSLTCWTGVRKFSDLAQIYLIRFYITIIPLEQIWNYRPVDFIMSNLALCNIYI